MQGLTCFIIINFNPLNFVRKIPFSFPFYSLLKVTEPATAKPGSQPRLSDSQALNHYAALLLGNFVRLSGWLNCVLT